MKWQQRVIQAWQKAREIPYLGRSSFAVAMIFLVTAIAMDWHRTHPDDGAGEAIQQARQAQMAVPKTIMVLSRVLPYLNLWVSLGVPLLLLVIWRRWGDLRRLMLPVSIASVTVVAWMVASELVDYVAHSQMTEMGEPPAPTAFVFKLIFIALAVGSAPFALQYYRKTTILERYTLRTLVHPLLFCFVSFCSLWIIMDLLDNLKDFQMAKSSFGEVLGFYLGLLPYIYVTVMPVALLLAVLLRADSHVSRQRDHLHARGRAQPGAGFEADLSLHALCRAAEPRRELLLGAARRGQPQGRGAGAGGKRGGLHHGVRHHVSQRADPPHLVHRHLPLLPAQRARAHARRAGARGRPEGAPVRTILAPSASWTPGDGWRFFDGQELLYQNGSVTCDPAFSPPHKRHAHA